MKPSSPLPWRKEKDLSWPGKYEVLDEDGYGVVSDVETSDMDYIIHSCNAYPKLVEIVLSIRQIEIDAEEMGSQVIIGMCNKTLKSIGEVEL